MRVISNFFFIVGIVFGLLGIRKYWREHLYVKASIVEKAKVLSAYVKPNPFKAISSIRMELTFMREGRFDTIEYNFSETYSINNPLPTETAYKAKTYYVRFVPRKNRREWIPNWLIVGNEQKFDGHYGRTQFGIMFTLFLLGLMIRKFGRMRRTPNGLLLLLILYSNGLFVFSDVCP